MNQRKRLRDWGITIGSFAPGTHNAITDIEGITVAHFTLAKDTLSSSGVQKCVRTGITAVIPYPLHIERRLLSGHFFLRSQGDVTGYEVLDDFCYLKSPIVLANPFIAGRAYNALLTFGFERNREIWPPLIITLDDSYLNDMDARMITDEHVIEAINTATIDVAEGSVGAGAGLISYDCKGGIGTSSRIAPILGKNYTIGSLVAASNLHVPNSNQKRHEEMSSAVSGKPGTLAIVLATNAPLIPTQLKELAKEGAMSQANLISSQDGIASVAFTTVNVIDESEGSLNEELEYVSPEKSRLTYQFKFIEENLAPLYSAAREVVKEAICNALLMATPSNGRLNRKALPITFESLKELFLNKQ